MQVHPISNWLLTAGLFAGSCGFTLAQAPNQPTAQPVQTSSQPASPVRAARRHRVTRRTNSRSSAITSIPLETAPPTSETSATLADKARQKAADDRLLSQQQAQSQRAAQITDATVQKAVQQQQNVQNETRIQDAPGPAQTGLVPTSGPPVQPSNNDVRIQDAPGPAQTVPAPTQPVNPPTATPPQV